MSPTYHIIYDVKIEQRDVEPLPKRQVVTQR